MPYPPDDQYDYDTLEQMVAPPPPPEPPPLLPERQAMAPEPPPPPPMVGQVDYFAMDPPAPPEPPPIPLMDPPAAPPPPGYSWAFEGSDASRLPQEHGGGWLLSDEEGENFYMPETGEYAGQPVNLPKGSHVFDLIAFLREGEAAPTNEAVAPMPIESDPRYRR